MKKILLDTLTSFRASRRNSTTYAPSPRGLLLISLVLACFASSAQTQAVTPPLTPDPGSVSLSNTADGRLALAGLTTGIYNSAFGFYSLLSNADANFNTGVGAGTLLLNTASENTAVGAGALLSNAVGTSNTAVGAFAGFSNVVGPATRPSVIVRSKTILPAPTRPPVFTHSSLTPPASTMRPSVFVPSRVTSTATTTPPSVI